MMRSISRLFSFVLLFALTHVAQAQDTPVLLGVNSGSGGQFLAIIDETDGTLTNLGDTGLTIDGIASGDGILYAADNGNDRLVTLNPATGAVDTVIGPYGTASTIEAMAYRSEDGALFGIDLSLDQLVQFNTTTGEAVAVGPLGTTENLAGLSFAPNGTLYSLAHSSGSLFTINPDTGNATLVATGPGLGPLGLAIHPDTGVLYTASWTGGADMLLETVSTADATRTLVGTMVGGQQIEGLTFTGDAGPAGTTASFQVTKAFSDSTDESVEVTLTCNGGTPLTQSFTISPGAGVTFSLLNADIGSINCTVTETSGVTGYTPSYDNGSVVSATSCAYTNVTPTAYSCAITNSPSTFDFEVDVVWDDASEPTGTLSFDIQCDNVGDSLDTVTSPETYTADAPTDETFTWTAVGAPSNETDGQGNPINVTTCSVINVEASDSAVSATGCDGTAVPFGTAEAGCTLSASAFFQGIPTLSQYGMAIMALLMLGLGFVGLRRFA